MDVPAPFARRRAGAARSRSATRWPRARCCWRSSRGRERRRSRRPRAGPQRVAGEPAASRPRPPSRRRGRGRGGGGGRRRGARAEAAAPASAEDAEPPPYASPAVRRLGARARDRPLDGEGIGPQGPDHARRTSTARRERAAPPPRRRAPAALPGRPDSRRRSSACRCRGSRRSPARTCVRSWTTIPHVTQHDEADITDLEAFRKEINASQKDVKVTMVALLVKACVARCRSTPRSTPRSTATELMLKRYWNIGFAADTPQGLVVPGDQGRRPQGHPRDRRRADARCPAPPARASSRSATCRARRSRSPASAASAARSSRRSSTRREVAILGVVALGDEAGVGRRASSSRG